MNNVIKSKKELQFYIMADRMMNRGYFKRSILRIIYELIIPDVLMDYLVAMRMLQYYTPPICSSKSAGTHDEIKMKTRRKGIFRLINEIRLLYYKRKFIRLGYKLGYSIGPYCFGYGLTLHHHGTIIVGSNNRIGNYALINTSTNIIHNGSTIGDGLFLGSGVKIIKKVALGNNICIGANSVVNTSFEEDNILIAGIPGKKKKIVNGAWYDSLYGKSWKEKHDAIEKLRERMLC